MVSSEKVGDTQTGNRRVGGSWNQGGWGRGEEEKEEEEKTGERRFTRIVEVYMPDFIVSSKIVGYNLSAYDYSPTHP